MKIFFSCAFFLLFVACIGSSENLDKFLLNEISIEKQKSLSFNTKNSNANIVDIVFLTFSEKTDPSTVRANISLQQKETKKDEELLFDFSKNPVISFQIPNQEPKINYLLKIGMGLKSVTGSPIILESETAVKNKTETIKVLYK